MSSGLAPLVAPVRSFVARHPELASSAQRLLDRFPRLQDAVFALALGDPQARYEAWVAEYDTLDDGDIAAMREEQARWVDPPLLSVLVPDELSAQLPAQVYERWQVRVAGEAVADWNTALREVESEHVVVFQRGTVLRPHALFLLALTIGRHPDAALIYADEDVLGENNARSRHYFKPDWNEALVRSQHYLGGFVCIRRSLALAVGGFRDELDGGSAWGLFLRLGAAAAPSSIHHLPFVLSHRRTGEPAPGGARRRRGARALELLLTECGEHVRVEPVGEASYRTQYVLPEQPPSVSVVVPTTCRLELLRPCLDGLLNRTAYPELEILVVVNGVRTLAAEQREYLDAIGARPRVRVLFHDDRPYNFSRTSNWAAAQAGGELLCFLNDDTEVIGSDWLSTMAARVLQDRVAVVGALLLFPSGRIQHAGIVLGVGHVAGHNYARRPRGIRGYHDRALIDQDVSAVTAACMLVRRDVFLEAGGFDEALAIAFNDIDFCLRLREAGWRIMWTPSAELYHRESASIIRHHAAEREAEWRSELELMQSRWVRELVADPHYNPNLSLDALRLWEPASPPRVSYPWRIGARSVGIDPGPSVSR